MNFLLIYLAGACLYVCVLWIGYFVLYDVDLDTHAEIMMLMSIFGTIAWPLTLSALIGVTIGKAIKHVVKNGIRNDDWELK